MKNTQGERGQAAIGLVLVLALVLVGGVGFAVDEANALFHRLNAQSAADAACQAGGMDMYAGAGGESLPNSGLTPGQPGDCQFASGSSICQYASMNGYTGGGLSATSASNSVTWNWPTSVAGVMAAPASVAANAFLQVVITENLPTYFLGSVGGPSVQKIVTSSTCGLVQGRNSSPIIILNPILPASLALAVGAELNIVSGPPRGLQVNSADPLAVVGALGGNLNTSDGGPGDAGSSVGIVGGPPDSGGLLGASFSGGANGLWESRVAAMPDPFAGVAPPTSVSTTPASGLAGKFVSYHQDGCPDSLHSCLEFAPGFYPLGINVQTLLSGARTAIFLPGVYSLGGPLTSTGNILRNATPCVPSCGPLSTSPGSVTDGVMFYFQLGALTVAGSPSTVGVDSVPSTALSCDGSAPDANLNVPAAVNGTVLWAQCTANGTYWDSGGDTADSAGSSSLPGSRGLLAFSSHINLVPPAFAASNGITLAGALYYHNVLYLDIVPFGAQIVGDLLGGTSNIYVLGPMVVDQLTIAAGTQLNVGLSSQSNQYLTKVAMVQ